MKKWNTPMMVELNIEETACGWWDTKPAPGVGGPKPGPSKPIGGPNPIPGNPIAGPKPNPIPGGLPGDEETDGLS